MRRLDAVGLARIRALPPRSRGALYRAVETAEARVALFHRHRGPRGRGAPAPHPLALTPFVLSPRALPDLRTLAHAVHRLQAHAPLLHRADAAGFRALCPVTAETEAWLGLGPARPQPWCLMIRPDVGLGATADGRSLPILFETNATGLAGLYNHSIGVRILREVVFPRIFTPAEARRLQDPPDLLALAVRWVVRAGRRLGRRRLRGIAFVEPPRALDGYSEVPRLVAAFRAAGIPAARGTPADLRLTRQGLRLRDLPVDVVYREATADEVGPVPARGAGLAGFRAAWEAGVVLPGPAGEFSHKGLLECLSRPELERLLTGAERRVLRAVVPWTRVLTARRTDDPAGRRVDLPEYVRRHATALLIKPNVGSSGEGILLGREASDARWDARLARALREPGRWVVQARRPGLPRPVLYLRAGRAYAGPGHASLGLFYTPGDLGLHGRVSQDPVVNVGRRGALACAFLARDAPARGGISPG